MGPEAACRSGQVGQQRHRVKENLAKQRDKGRNRGSARGERGLCWFLFCLALGGVRVVVMVFTLLSLPITRKKKTSPIGRQLSSLHGSVGFSATHCDGDLMACF